MVHGCAVRKDGNRKTKILGAIFAGALMASAIGGSALAGKGGAPPERVTICHVDGSSDVVSGLGNPDRKWAFGRLIEVSERSVAAHEAHGDHDSLWAGDDAAGGYLTPTSHTGGLHGGAWQRLHVSAEGDGLTIHRKSDCASFQYNASL